MVDASRLLGFAFAAADLLIELDAEGRVSLALGAGPSKGADPAGWIGKPLGDHLDADGRIALGDAIAAMGAADRTPQVALTFAVAGHGRRAHFRAFRLPQNRGATSCAISWDGPAFKLEAEPPLAMLDARGLLDRVRRLMGAGGASPLDVAFVSVPGLDGDSAPHQRAAARVEAALKSASVDGSSAARLATDRFALVRNPADTANLADEVRRAGEAEGLTLEAEVSQDRVDPGAESDMVMRALRMALDSCVRDGVGVARFGERLKKTVEGAERFKATVRTREFKLVYQPVVDLDTRAVHHFEALTRFGPDSPQATIRMAEELGLVEGFDLAVAEKALRQLKKPGFGLVKVAVNASAGSLGGDGYVEGLLKLTASSPDLRKRLMVEITETAALADLEAAERRLKALRQAGVHVCLDDFGAGAASFDYLRKLGVDTVKIDGAFVRDLEDGDRSRTLIDHLVKLCADLKLNTIAEMVETEAQAEALQKLGVDMGQGWLFGKPADEPVVASVSQSAAARRVGTVTGWG